MKKLVGRLAVVLLLAFVLATSLAASVSADAGSKTLTTLYDQYYYETKTAYMPSGIIRGFGGETFSAPSDLKVQDGILYVCDTKNARILAGTPEGELAAIIGEGVLDTPSGLCIASDGHILVADKGLGQVVEFDAGGQLVQTFGRPEEPLYGQDNAFLPLKVGIDRSDNLYVLSEANTNGLAQISRKTGEFVAYFGANDTPVTLWTVVSSVLYTDEQKSRANRNLPPSSVNLAVDRQGLVYTITDAKTTSAYRKLNFSGESMQKNPFAFSDQASITLTGICVGDVGNVYLCSKDGYILEFTREGELLFVFGGLDDGSQRNGLFASTSAIAADGGNLYVLDDSKNVIQMFDSTVFAQTVHEGLYLYQQGKYQQSEALWREVAQMDSMFLYANKGLGAAYYKQDKFVEAMESYRLALDREGYSDAFVELRNRWVRENIGWLLGGVFGVVLIALLYSRLRRRVPVLAGIHERARRIKNLPLLAQLGFSKRVLRQPADAYYGIKHEGKTSPLSATILYLLFFLWFVLGKYFQGFLFSGINDGRFDVLLDAGMVLGAFLLVNGCLYLVCTVTEGEAHFRDLYSGIIYAMAPYLFLKPLAVLLSHVLSQNESFLIYLLEVAAIAASAVLLVVMVREMNNYTYSKTFKVLFLTLFALLIAVAALFVLYILFQQFGEFIFQLMKEVRYRVRIS